jgi:hypothetical protein
MIMEIIAKINLDYVEGELEEILEEKIVSSTVEQLKKNVEEVALKAITETLKGKIDGWILETLNSFIDRPIRITDNYGTIKETYANVNDMLKEKLDGFLSAPVDYNGNDLSKSCSANKDNTRLVYLVDRRVKDITQGWTKQIVSEVDKKVTEHLNIAFKAQISEALFKKIDMAELLNK